MVARAPLALAPEIRENAAVTAEPTPQSLPPPGLPGTRPSSPTLPLVLASASPRRAELLRSAGIAFSIAPVDCDERWLPGEAPIAYVERVARAKAEMALQPGHVVLAADSTVWLEGQAEPIGKPPDRAGARATLERLAGARHLVSTAFAVVDARAPAPRWLVETVTTAVWMRPLAPEEIEAYLDADDWRDKAGGYGIQSRAAGIVRRIEGSYTNVVGLPLAEVIEALRGLS